MFTKFKEFLCKCLVRVVKIYNKDEFPNYNTLQDLASVKIHLDNGIYIFNIKRAHNADWDKDVGFFKRRYYTVELDSCAFDKDNDWMYNKIMLTVKVKLLDLEPHIIIACLVSMYITELGEGLNKTPKNF